MKKKIIESFKKNKTILLMDDCKLFYKVIDVLPNSAIVQIIDNCPDQGCEVIPFTCMENEKWQIMEVK